MRIPARGLLISWATPAAMRPTEATFSDWTELEVGVLQLLSHLQDLPHVPEHADASHLLVIDGD